MSTTYEQEKAWRQSLKEGDGVVITGRGTYRNMSIGIVQRTTATQIIIQGDTGVERRFNKTYGREIGVSYGPSISPITEKARVTIRATKNRNEFSSLTHKLERLADDEIAAMLAAYHDLRDSKAVPE